jgi:hypothetical protein
VAIESSVHYAEEPPPGREPFVVVRRASPVVLSAPHGAITYRNNAVELWHQEDDYTAGIALLLSERCGTSAMATIWRATVSDPNYHREKRSAYKRALRKLVEDVGARWVIDLHGLADSSLPPAQLVDLGTRKEKQSLPQEQLDRLVDLVESRVGQGTVHHNRFSAYREERTITAFSHGVLGLHAVQVELKSAVRVPRRRTDATAFAETGPYAADPAQVIALLQALADFVVDLS